MIRPQKCASQYPFSGSYFGVYATKRREETKKGEVWNAGSRGSCSRENRGGNLRYDFTLNSQHAGECCAPA